MPDLRTYEWLEMILCPFRPVLASSKLPVLPSYIEESLEGVSLVWVLYHGCYHCFLVFRLGAACEGVCCHRLLLQHEDFIKEVQNGR